MPYASPGGQHFPVVPWPVSIEAGGGNICGDLTVPEGALGLVIFAHGSGSGRHSERNRAVAQVMNRAHLATLLVDLLTEREERIDRMTAEIRFDILLLARRVTGAIDWVSGHQQTHRLRIGLFGASTGAAAALIAAAERPDRVRAVVSRGGRPDLAGDALDAVTSPTMLIVGGLDRQVLQLNRWAFEHLHSEKQLEIVTGATHLFEEPGALDEVARLAASWFGQHVSPSHS